mgnify:FL=1
MANYEIAKAKIEATAMMCKSFYTDFMPMIQQIKSNVESLKITEQNTDALNNICKQLERAESLLKQLSKLSNRNSNANKTKAILDVIKDGSLKHQPKEKGQYLIKVDEDYIYVLSETEGKIDLLDNKWVKVKEIDIEELEV